MLPAMVMAAGIRPGQTTTAAATTHGQWCHTTALTATAHGPIPAIRTALTPLPASPHFLALPRITPAAVTQLLPPVITSTIRPVTPAAAFPVLPFPLVAAPIIPVAARTIQAAVSAALGEDLVVARRTTPVVASAVDWVAHRQEAPASAAAPTTAATLHTVDLAVLHPLHRAVALPATPVADITAAAATACTEGRNDLQGT